MVPWGFGKMLRYVKDRYSDPEIYVTESGADVPKESKMSLQKALKDDFRVKYFKVSLENVGHKFLHRNRLYGQLQVQESGYWWDHLHGQHY